jgi:hypothetical protein
VAASNENAIGDLILWFFVLVYFMVLIGRWREVLGPDGGIEDKREVRLLCG